jgi:hypothetical protein
MCKCFVSDGEGNDDRCDRRLWDHWQQPYCSPCGTRRVDRLALSSASIARRCLPPCLAGRRTAVGSSRRSSRRAEARVHIAVKPPSSKPGSKPTVAVFHHRFHAVTRGGRADGYDPARSQRHRSHAHAHRDRSALRLRAQHPLGPKAFRRSEHRASCGPIQLAGTAARNDGADYDWQFEISAGEVAGSGATGVGDVALMDDTRLLGDAAEPLAAVADLPVRRREPPMTRCRLEARRGHR